MRPISCPGPSVFLNGMYDSIKSLLVFGSRVYLTFSSTFHIVSIASTVDDNFVVVVS